MSKAKIFATEIAGTTNVIKAYTKKNAVIRFMMLDKSIRAKDVYELKNTVNSHQATIEDEYPEICE